MNESLDSRQLKAFDVLAKTGSFTETARQLYLTHSAISHSMKSLESQVGCRLLSKLGKKTVLTEAGEAFLHHARRALEEMQRARATASQYNRWGSRRLRVVAQPALGSAVLKPTLTNFYREFPNVLIQVEMGNADDPAHLLENNQADLVLSEKPADNHALNFISLLADRFHFVVNASHPLASHPGVTRKELASHPCLLLRTSSHARKRLDEFLDQHGIGLSRIGELECVDTVKEMVKNHSLMSLLPSWAVVEEVRNQTLIALPSGRKPFEQIWGILHSHARPMNHAEATFLKFCRQQFAKLE